MPKKKPIQAIDLSNFNSGLDDVLSELAPSSKAPEPERPATEPAEEKATTKPTKQLRKKKVSRTASPPKEEEQPVVPPPTGALAVTEEQLKWLTGSPDARPTKQVYVTEATRDALQYAAKAAGVPAAYLVDNLIRLFLYDNRAKFKKMISRNPLDRIDV